MEVVKRALPRSRLKVPRGCEFLQVSALLCPDDVADFLGTVNLVGVWVEKSSCEVDGWE